MTLSLAFQIVPVLLVAAAVFDCLYLRIPNWLTAALALAFFAAAPLAGMPLVQFGWHVAVATVVLLIGMGLFFMNWLGAGDAKLLAAVSLWFGWPTVLPFVVFTAIAGAVVAIGATLWAAIQVDQDARGASWLSRLGLMSFKPNVPYGLAIAAGGLLVWPQTWWMIR